VLPAVILFSSFKETLLQVVEVGCAIFSLPPSSIREEQHLVLPTIAVVLLRKNV
jgi:hypothetical protein